MSETGIVDLFTVVRILLIGGVMIVIPLITRRGLLFGVYVGEDVAEGAEARRLVRRWSLGCAVLIAISIVLGLSISAAGHPLGGNLVATVAMMLAGAGWYLRQHFAARGLATPATSRQAEIAAAPVETGEVGGVRLAWLALVLCLVAGLATATYTMARYEAMPERVPTHFGVSGVADAWSDKSVVSVMLLPTMNLVLSPFLAVMALLTAHAKRSVRGGTGGRSVEAQNAFRAATSRLLSAAALFTGALMSYLSVQTIRVALGETPSLGQGVWWITGGMVVCLLGGTVWIMARYGQGGALVEQGSAEAPLTNGLADNTHWVLGVFYVNKDDPSILVEKRFGVGYTINFGNRWAVLLIVGFLALVLGLAAVGVIGSTN